MIRLRVALAVVGAMLLAWIAWQTVRAGSDVPPPAKGPGVTRLNGGAAADRRLDGRSWSLDYGAATMSQDGSTVEIDDVRDGVILRGGKPYLHMQAKHVSANLTTNDFTAHGKVVFTELADKHRTLATTDAHYEGTNRTLYLTQPTTIRQAAAQVQVRTVIVNFDTGEMTLGRIMAIL